MKPDEGATIRAGDAWELLLQWYAEKGAEPGTQKRFGARMKMDFLHDKTNNRPRYINVRMKRRAADLRIVPAAKNFYHRMEVPPNGTPSIRSTNACFYAAARLRIRPWP